MGNYVAFSHVGVEQLIVYSKKWQIEIFLRLCKLSLALSSTSNKPSLYSPYYAEACNELRGPSPRLSTWVTQLRRNVATVASRWRHCVDLTGPGIESQTSRADSVRLATELTAGLILYMTAMMLESLQKIKVTII